MQINRSPIGALHDKATELWWQLPWACSGLSASTVDSFQRTAERGAPSQIQEHVGHLRWFTRAWSSHHPVLRGRARPEVRRVGYRFHDRLRCPLRRFRVWNHPPEL